MITWTSMSKIYFIKPCFADKASPKELKKPTEFFDSVLTVLLIAFWSSRVTTHALHNRKWITTEA